MARLVSGPGSGPDRRRHPLHKVMVLLTICAVFIGSSIGFNRLGYGPRPITVAARNQIHIRPTDRVSVVPAFDSVADAVAEAAAAGPEMVVVMAHGLDPTRPARRPAPAANDHRPHDFASAMRRVEHDFYAAV